VCPGHLSVASRTCSTDNMSDHRIGQHRISHPHEDPYLFGNQKPTSHSLVAGRSVNSIFFIRFRSVMKLNVAVEA
jgi:hypothetical protein